MYYSFTPSFFRKSECVEDEDSMGYEVVVDGCYRLSAKEYTLFRNDGSTFSFLSIQLIYVRPELGYCRAVCVADGIDADEAIDNFIFKSKNLCGEDFTMFHLAIGKFIKCDKR